MMTNIPMECFYSNIWYTKSEKGAPPQYRVVVKILDSQEGNRREKRNQSKIEVK